jgi:hypothetical protein
MENTTIIFQRLRHSVDDEFELAEKYYSLLSVVNDLGLTRRELQLVSFMAIKGSISYSKLKDDFCEKYGTTVPTFNNLVCKLNKMKVLVRDKKRARVNPGIVIDFEKPLKLEINLIYG